MMSQARFDVIFSSMTAAAKKVYQAVPIADSWSTVQIIAELARLGFSHEHRTVSGCLNTLISAGLVQETGKGLFCREPIREKTPPPKEDIPDMKPPTPKPVVLAPVKSPVDRIGDLAARVAALSIALKDLASEISDAAIDIETMLEQNKAEMEKFKQLQAILKSLN